MVLKHDSITERLKELDTVLQELSRYSTLTEEELRTNLSQRWIIERGLIAAAALILDVADHILVGHFGLHTANHSPSKNQENHSTALRPSIIVHQKIKKITVPIWQAMANSTKVLALPAKFIGDLQVIYRCFLLPYGRRSLVCGETAV